ncbi:DNA packaging tegument protein UL17 [Equid alphaherpesvirus 3]|uniref:DNA packaging tegument protein UL17 n=1 Tax=Equid alphaherpesvirus 3 TaxID=80341 RepID=A0A077BCM1_9ALPH|nr:DNA packaging tegument protein UL17 [Equid alphaherpesvirus 3]AIL02963.1 DNA packaging tegument protein UL17 [Equid alphaherpesvirus 3]
MNAHIANETRHQMAHARRRDRGLVHIVIPDACLAKAGIEPFRLGSRRAPGSSAATFRVYAQTRYHASGECSPWRSVFSGYVSSGALASALVPALPEEHPGLFRFVPDSGGLFVSLDVECDANGRFDAFTVAALRVDLADDPLLREVLFTYDELLPPGTRYGADAARVALLCRQFAAYVRSRPDLPHDAVVAGSHIEAGLRDAAASDAALPEVVDGDAINPSEGLVSGGGFDNAQALARLEEDDREIMSLIRRATEAIARRNPVRVRGDAAEGGGPVRRRHVASGLRQGARGARPPDAPAAPGAGGGQREAAALLMGLEPPNSGRFVEGGGRRHLPRQGLRAPADRESPAGALDDVLLITPENANPLTALDWLDVGYAALAGGDTPADVWRRRPVSMVARKHYSTRETFVVLSYEHSTAWGGRRAPTGHLAGSAHPAVLRACLVAGVDHPRNLPPEAREKLVAEFPFLRVPLANTPPPVAAFDAAGETALLGSFRAACVTALLDAVAESLRASPRMSQLLEYELHDRHRECILRVTERAPELLEAVALAVRHASVAEFVNGALMLSALSYLSSRAGAPAGRLPCHRAWFPSLAGGNAVFLFDYYSSGGEVVRVSPAPLAIFVDAPQSGQHSCRFARGAPSAASRTYERYLPGECYAYVCLGFNRALEALVVFPGGFAFRADVAKQLVWPAHLVEPILARFCWTIPAH